MARLQTALFAVVGHRDSNGMSRDTQPSVLHTRPVAAAPAPPLAGHSPLRQELTKTGPQLPLSRRNYCSRTALILNYTLATAQLASSSQASLPVVWGGAMQAGGLRLAVPGRAGAAGALLPLALTAICCH